MSFSKHTSPVEEGYTNGGTSLLQEALRLCALFEKTKNDTLRCQLNQLGDKLTRTTLFSVLDFRLLLGKSALIIVLIELAQINQNPIWLKKAKLILADVEPFLLGASTDNSIEQGQLGLFLAVLALYEADPSEREYLQNILEKIMNFILQQIHISTQGKIRIREKWEKQLWWIINALRSNQENPQQKKIQELSELGVFGGRKRRTFHSEKSSLGHGIRAHLGDDLATQFFIKRLLSFSLRSKTFFARLPIFNRFLTSHLFFNFPTTLHEIGKENQTYLVQLFMEPYTHQLRVLELDLKQKFHAKSLAVDAFRWEKVCLKVKYSQPKITFEDQLEAIRKLEYLTLQNDDEIIAQVYRLNAQARFKSFYYNWNDYDTILNKKDATLPNSFQFHYLFLPVWYDQGVEVIQISGLYSLLYSFKAPNSAIEIFESANLVYKHKDQGQIFKQQFVDFLLRAVHLGALRCTSI